MKSNNAVKSYSGFSLIELLIVVLVIGIIAAIAIPNFLRARAASNEASAIATLRAVSAAQAVCHTINTNKSYCTNNELVLKTHLDSRFTSSPAIIGSYKFAINVLGTNGSLYEAKAEPITYQTSGFRSFAVNESGTIYYIEAATAPGFDLSTRQSIGGSAL